MLNSAGQAFLVPLTEPQAVSVVKQVSRWRNGRLLKISNEANFSALR